MSPTPIEIPSKTVFLTVSYRAAIDLAHSHGLKPREYIVAAESNKLQGLILREGDRVVVADTIPVRLWETLQHCLAAAGCAIAAGGILVKVR